MDIDVNFDFTTDSVDYWDDFWNRNNGLGAGGSDPDSTSKTLQKFHSVLWSRQLPNGEIMNLTIGSGSDYLTWKNFRFGSDSITASFRYNRYKTQIDEIRMCVPNYKDFMEDFIRKSYTIGGTIIFPKRMGGINQTRGCNRHIQDRWDLTLECIRRFYNDEESPLSECILKDKNFFDLFVDFKGYVEFFFLQDCVSPDYERVLFWLGDGNFDCEPLPKTPDDYINFIDNELAFVRKRNSRIQEFVTLY